MNPLLGSETDLLLDALFAPSEPPPVRVFAERMTDQGVTLVRFACRVCRGGAKAAINDQVFESARAHVEVFKVMRFLAQRYQPHVCPGHDPGDEDRS